MTLILDDHGGEHHYEVHRHGEHSAVYKDGQLAHGPSDHYLAIEWLFGELGIEDVRDAAFMLGGTGAASTTDAILTYRRDREVALENARKLRVEAEEQIRRADEIERTWIR